MPDKRWRIKLILQKTLMYLIDTIYRSPANPQADHRKYPWIVKKSTPVDTEDVPIQLSKHLAYVSLDMLLESLVLFCQLFKVALIELISIVNEPLGFGAWDSRLDIVS